MVLQALSDAELLAIFLRSGSQQHSAVELARLLIQHFGNLTTLLDAPIARAMSDFTAWVTVNTSAASWQSRTWTALCG